jgi:Tol biopolymer transport system component
MVYDPNKLDIFNHSTGALLPVVNEMAQGNFTWSPNSQWLAFTKSIESGLFVLDMSTFSVIELPFIEHDYILSAWSSDNQLLAIFKNPTDGTTSLYSWSPNAMTTVGSISSGDVRSLHWSPDNAQIMLTVYEEEQAKLLVMNVSDGNTQELFAIDRVDIIEREYGFEHISELQGLSWSPDGELFLLYAEPEGKAGLYVIHHDGGAAYLIVETGLYVFDSRRVIWLSE